MSSSLFRIYYSDGSFYDGLVAEAPREGYQAVCEKRDGRRFLHIGGDYCCYKEGVWKCDAYSKGEVVLTGKLIDDEVFENIKREAVAWLKAA